MAIRMCVLTVPEFPLKLEVPNGKLQSRTSEYLFYTLLDNVGLLVQLSPPEKQPMCGVNNSPSVSCKIDAETSTRALGSIISFLYSYDAYDLPDNFGSTDRQTSLKAKGMNLTPSETQQQIRSSDSSKEDPKISKSTNSVCLLGPTNELQDERSAYSGDIENSLSESNSTSIDEIQDDILLLRRLHDGVSCASICDLQIMVEKLFAFKCKTLSYAYMIQDMFIEFLRQSV